MSADNDGFSRWNAGQQLAIEVIQSVMAALVNEPAPAVDERLLEAYRQLLQDESLDPAMVALMLSLPSEAYLADLEKVVDVDAIHYARKRVQRKIALVLFDAFKHTYERLNTTEAFSIDASAIAQRSLKNAALHYMMVGGSDTAIGLCKAQLESATNMSDELAALTAIVNCSKASIAQDKSDALANFYTKWQDEALVVNHWFAVQCACPLPNTLDTVLGLMKHEAFDIKNPNKLRSVIGGFSMRNPINFHHKSGKGYAFLADQILLLDTSNPQIAARLLSPFTKWKRYDELRQGLMKSQLQRIHAKEGLSKDVFEVVEKTLSN